MFNSVSRQFHYGLKCLFYKPPLDGDYVSELIQSKLSSTEPVMIGRFGSTEIKGVIYPFIPFIFKPLVKKIIFNDLYINSGFFPSTEQSILKFSNLMIEDMKLLDILGSWRVEESFFNNQLSNVKKVRLSDLEPYLSENPWSIALENKKILVIHPFNKTIESQYHNNREQLFIDKRVLPNFQSLETIKAVQTIVGNRSNFNNWFDALNYMKSEIDRKDFDIAIIGCGAYGFPLAAHIKRMGKKAIHLGGATQILFGIKGKRWIENPKFNNIINEHFVFPSNDDKVENFQKMEGGAYW